MKLLSEAAVAAIVKIIYAETGDFVGCLHVFDRKEFDEFHRGMHESDEPIHVPFGFIPMGTSTPNMECVMGGLYSLNGETVDLASSSHRINPKAD